MKKVIFSFLLSLLCLSGFSQVKIGAKLGLNYSHFLDISSTESFEINPAFSPHYGLLVEFALGEKFALQTELLLNSKRTEVVNIFQEVRNPTTFELAFISVPLLAKYKIGNWGIIAGVEPSQRVFQRVISEQGASTVDFISFGNKFDIGATAGLSYNINRFNIGLRYTRGFRGIFDIAFTDENGQPLEGFKNNYARVYQLSLGYFFKS